MKISYDVVKRWVNEAQEAASSDNIMVQVLSTNHISYIYVLRSAFFESTFRGNLLITQMSIS